MKYKETVCWFCGGKMIWGSDSSFDEQFLDGEGIVAFLSCSKCEASAEFYLPINQGDN